MAAVDWHGARRAVWNEAGSVLLTNTTTQVWLLLLPSLTVVTQTACVLYACYQCTYS